MTNGAQYCPGRAWSIATMLALMMLVNFLDKVVLGLVSVPMMRDLHLSPTQFGVIGGSLNWLFAVAAVAGGIAANRWPAKWLLFAMAAAWALLQLPMLVAGSIWVVIACRVLLGIGEAPRRRLRRTRSTSGFPIRGATCPSRCCTRAARSAC
nr:MFS transporter [Burkholderia cenocepacia]